MTGLRHTNLIVVVLSVAVFFFNSTVPAAEPEQNTQGPADTVAVLRNASEPASENTAKSEDNAVKAESSGEFDFSKLLAVHAPLTTVSIGAIYPDCRRNEDPDRFKFLVELTSEGAAIESVTLSEFDDRDPKSPKNLKVLSPVERGSGIYSLASLGATLVDIKKRLPLDRLNWRAGQAATDPADGSQSVSFETVILDAASKPALKVTKTYRVKPGSYDLEIELSAENLSDSTLEPKLELRGPAGINREGVRSDMRRIAAAFLLPDGKIESTKIDTGKLKKAQQKNSGPTELAHKNAAAQLLWSAVTNKYFAAILRPVPAQGQERAKWSKPGQAEYYDSTGSDKNSGDEGNISFSLEVVPFKLAAAGQSDSAKTFAFELYVGPKDRNYFDKNELYRRLGYYHTIDFMGCCCPQQILNPLAFGIMTLMKSMYNAMGPFGNYGVVIIIFVFLVRLVMHPVTKKSQVSMMGMQKLGPKIEEVKKKYENNKAEMQKQIMQVYKEQGISPMMGFLPMLLQMPIWIALYSAIYANIELRGAGFLPFWITDLSAPDAVVRFATVTVPVLKWQIDSFNLLPLLLAVAMFLQQKLTPQTSAASQTNPQLAQQQKMMLVMMPVMMLLVLYKAPSGLNLYIMASTFAGVIEQVVIRKHIREKEEAEAHGLVPTTSKAGGKPKKKKPKPFFRDH